MAKKQSLFGGLNTMKIIRGLLAVFAMGWVSVMGAANSVPTVAISTVPLYGRSQNVHPNLMLSLSVEFPTTGAAYRGAYDKTQTYLGYFNATKCYNYDATNGYFVISGAANSSFECSGNFSGNFMNWAASSAIDEFRMALTGGDRVIDTSTQTVLQRAVLRSDFFRSGSYFPVKSINGSGNVSAPNKVTPFSYSTLYIVSCGNHIFFADQDYSSTSCSNPGGYGDQYDRKGNLIERRSFRAQVQVCDSNEGSTRTDLCLNYNGNYKPVGQMQLNADRMRFAAFGYLNDSTNDTTLDQDERYGGVLRAPMKYVGSTAVDTSLNAITNPAPEFDPVTGIFAQNPLNAAEGTSGVINYLNKFGRTSVQLPNQAMGYLGGPTDNPTGNYKTYDPVSEMFYESIRYLQFKQGPTPEAIAGLPNSTYSDNFPVYSTWNTDPMLSGCQRNYAFLIGDINTHEDHYIPGNQVTGQGDPARAVSSYDNFDVRAWTNKVGALETNTPAAGNSNPLSSSFTNLGDINHATSHWASYYLAGVAYWAHTYGFRPDMPTARVTTFVIDVNENGNGTVGATQRQSQFFLAAKYGGFQDNNNDGNPFKTFGPDGITVVNNNTEWEAAPTGSNIPYNWFLGGQPATMIAAIKNIFAQIVSYAGTLSGVALSSARITGGSGNNTYVYAPGFDQKWNGRLAAYQLTLNGTNVQVSSQAAWEAGALLTTAYGGTSGTKYTGRSVFTTNSDTGKGVTFAWANISQSQQTLLNTSPSSGTNDGNGQNRLNYLLGDQSKENSSVNSSGIFRARNSILGDIIGSAPTYVSDPSGAITDTGYTTFTGTYNGRTPMIYVGANDGMVHGFNANTGAEVFGYVPNAVFSGLNQLTSTAYAHRLFVDATPVAAEAQVNGNWRTVLTGGFGGGAQGVYALDVTDPTGSKGGSFTASNVLWEFTDKDDADMGNVMGTPLIVKLQTGTDTSKTPNVPIYKWFVMVGNGLNSNAVDGSYNANAPAALFLLSLDKPAGTPWQRNTNYFKIVTPIPGGTPPYTTANGLSTPAIVPAVNGRAMAAYAGDLQGNLWKFVLSGDSTTWNETSTALPAYGGGTTKKPLFAATDNYSTPGRNQPITMAPQIVYAPGGYMILFGTGKYYETSDTGTPTQYNSFYGIYDDGGSTNYITDRSKLNKLTATASSDGKSYSIAYATGAAAVGYASPRKPGWVLDFPDSTEKQVTAAVASDGVVYFNSLTGGDACGNNGSSRSYALNVLTGMPLGGTTTGYQSSTGLLGAPSLIVISIANASRDSVGGTVETKTKIVLSPGTQGLTVGNSNGSGGSGGSVSQITQRRGRAGWREVRNFTLN
ncbi:Type IV pilus biogenesis factor PilY1 [Ralstonia sp. LMG 32965]|nr:Type IV pilus biogenesis factor PilY1 [Ralstonia sp. LMG 32965]